MPREVESHQCFDSILVRLKERCRRRTLCYRWVCFDSILVRLKVYRIDECTFSLKKFRFHTGSIKSHRQSALLPRRTCFDSILVRLKAFPAPARATFWTGFDSILVRLKVINKALVHYAKSKFRFHTGSIKSSQDTLERDRVHVSIPYWFD